MEVGEGGGASDPRPAVSMVSRPAAATSVPASGGAVTGGGTTRSARSATAATPPPPTKEEELLALHRWRRVVERGPTAAVSPLPLLLCRSTRVYPHPAVDIDTPPRLRLHRLVVSGLHIDPTVPAPVSGEAVPQIAPLVCHLEAIAHTGATEKISTTAAAAPTTVRRMLVAPTALRASSPPLFPLAFSVLSPFSACPARALAAMHRQLTSFHPLPHTQFSCSASLLLCACPNSSSRAQPGRRTSTPLRAL